MSGKFIMISRDARASASSLCDDDSIGLAAVGQREEARPVKPGRLTAHIRALVASLHLPFLVFFTVPPPGRAAEPMPALTREQASGFARLALKGLGKEYPNKP